MRSRYLQCFKIDAVAYVLWNAAEQIIVVKATDKHQESCIIQLKIRGSRNYILLSTFHGWKLNKPYGGVNKSKKVNALR